MQHNLCKLLKNDDAPEYFQNIGNKICNEVSFLSITDETTTSEMKKRYNQPTLSQIGTNRMRIQKKILKQWLPECYGNLEYLTIVSN